MSIADFMAGGNGRLIAGLCEDLPVRYSTVVSSIRYCSGGVLVAAGSRQFSGKPFSPSSALCPLLVWAVSRHYI